MITGENYEAIDNGDCTDGRGTHDSDLGANPGRTRFTSPGGQRKSCNCSSKFETGQKPAWHERARRRHGGMPMMGMMNDMKNMMNGMSMMHTMEMMQTMGMMGPSMDGMATIDRIEGRIAFLRTELKITDTQADAWNAFADALRANAKKLDQLRASMMPKSGDAQQQAPTMADRLDQQEQWLLARLEGIRTMKAAFTKLNETLWDEQKKTANDLLAPHMGMGMMAMTAMQMQPGQMQPGQMGPGRMQPGQMQPPRTGN
jgi:hypothetical protein